MKSKYLIYILIIFSSCANKPFKNIDFSNGDYKLLFYDPFDRTDRDSIYYTNRHDFIKKYGNFYIDDVNTLNKFENYILKPTPSKTKQNNGAIYIVKLIRNGKSEFSGILQLNKKILISRSMCNFDLANFESVNKFFKKLDAHVVNCHTISEIKQVIALCENNNIFCPDLYSYKNRIINITGVIKVFASTKYLDISQSFNEIEKKIRKDFKKYDEASNIARLFYNGGDSIYLDVACNKDISNNLPVNYTLVKPFTDSIETQIYVVDISNEKLKKLLIDNKINASITELK